MIRRKLIICNRINKSKPLNIGTLLLLAIGLVACSAKKSMPSDGLFARIETNKGVILAQLEFEQAPLTVMNFVGLAEGRFDAPNAPQGKHYFDGLKFHRVEPGFVIQGGDPDGNGSGGPGYQFANEIVADLNHDSEGVLSMANAGPDTNGSQFFITLGEASFLNGNYSVFGQVVEGMDVVRSIEKDDVMEQVSIIRQGAEAEAFQPSWEQFQALSDKLHKEALASQAQFAEKSRQSLETFAQEQWPGITFNEGPNGLGIYILNEGSGFSAEDSGDVEQYRLHYSLWAPAQDGSIQKVDSSLERNQPIEIRPGQVIRGWSEALPAMKLGEKRVMLIPSELGYGKSGSPPMIQPNSYLLFEMELLNFIRK